MTSFREKSYCVTQKDYLDNGGQTIYSKNKNRISAKDTFLMLLIDSVLNRIFWYSIVADS